jgi:hypothetical protein
MEMCVGENYVGLTLPKRSIEGNQILLEFLAMGRGFKWPSGQALGECETLVLRLD